MMTADALHSSSASIKDWFRRGVGSLATDYVFAFALVVRLYFVRFSFTCFSAFGGL